MPKQEGEPFPTRDHVVDYVTAYEKRYELPIRRPVTVHGVHHDDDHLLIRTDTGDMRARTVISATGTWRSPHPPDIPGRALFGGRQLHTTDYRNPGLGSNGSTTSQAVSVTHHDAPQHHCGHANMITRTRLNTAATLVFVVCSGWCGRCVGVGA
ncbi:hypothetical protein HNR73_005914 [Phytomonospora endophytica]|uniref:Uncharacterized protein n=2 Tax=Phytomonospora endophytica TaxID=714109 RepID=A0A841FQB9_9ACTN|nr:hypothetical protein [Phytomonospora endophytica]GIG68935.1 hypothetical protein Pen01_52300 [Phytomonospora endophytica]